MINYSEKLSDRMKSYEMVETEDRFPTNSYLYARVDGRSFSNFTRRNFNGKFSTEFAQLMDKTATQLLLEFKPLIVYTQSDEISMVFDNSALSPAIFEGRKQKMLSCITGYASSVFASEYNANHPDKARNYPSFDGRLCLIPNKAEVSNMFLWRERDAVRNSISMMASEIFSHKELHKKSQDDRLNMLFLAGKPWSELDPRFARGQYFVKDTITKIIDDKPCLRSTVLLRDNYIDDLPTVDQRIEFIFGPCNTE